MSKFELNINNTQYSVEAEPDMPLLWVLREIIGLTGTKFGCGGGFCGACTVHKNGEAIRSCITPISFIKSEKITTIEGISSGDTLHHVQDAWIDKQVSQCGYCQPGQIMSAVALLEKIPYPTDKDIDNAMNGNLCRCGTYQRIRQAIYAAAKTINNPTASGGSIKL